MNMNLFRKLMGYLYIVTRTHLTAPPYKATPANAVSRLQMACRRKVATRVVVTVKRGGLAAF